MTVPVRPRPKYVIGPDGSPLTITDLPAPGTKRWVIRRKAEVIAAVRGGLLSIEEAAATCSLSMNYSRGNPHSTSTASLGYARRASSNIGCNGGLDRFRHRREFSYVVSRSEDIDLK